MGGMAQDEPNGIAVGDRLTNQTRNVRTPRRADHQLPRLRHTADGRSSATAHTTATGRAAR